MTDRSPYVVVRHNTRTGTKRVIGGYPNIEQAEARANRGNAMHAAVGMGHYVDRVVAAEQS